MASFMDLMNEAMGDSPVKTPPDGGAEATPYVDATGEPGPGFEQTPVEALPADTQPEDTSLTWEPSCQVAWEATTSVSGTAHPWRGHVTAFRVDSVPASLAEHTAALQALVLLPTPPVSEAPTEEAFAAAVAEPEAVSALLAQLLSGSGAGMQLLNADGTALRPPTPPPSPGPAERVRRFEVKDPRLKELLEELQPQRKLFKARPAQPVVSDVITAADLAYISAAAGGPYCVLRALSHPLRLSPFTLDALIAALATPQPSQLLAEVHTALLRVLVASVADEDAGAAAQRPGGGASGEGGEGDGVNSARLADPMAQWAKLLDTVTWPAYARLYLRHVIAGGGEVPPRLAGQLATAEPHALAPRHRVALLAFLTDQLMHCTLMASELDARRGLLEGPSTSRAAGARSRRRGPSRLALAAPVVGAHVEVCGVEPGLRGSWYAANVMATSPGGGAVRVRYLDLLTDDSTRPLEEWVSLEPLGHGTDDVDGDDDMDGDGLDPADRDGLLRHGLPVQLAPGFERQYRVRPVPPAMPVPADVEAGSLVEVRHNDGWWHAQLLRPDGHRYLVRLPGEDATERIPRRDMRWALRWRLGDHPGGDAAATSAEAQQQVMGQWYLAATGMPVPGGLVPASSDCGEATMNLDSCAICHRPGQLLCCDSCPLALHYTCAGETKGSLPEGDYFCPECAAQPPTPPTALCDVPGHAGGSAGGGQAGAACGAWVYAGADSAGRPHWVLRPHTLARLEVGASRRQRGSCDALYPTAATVVTGRWATQAADGLGTSSDADDVALSQRLGALLTGKAAPDGSVDVMEVDADATTAQVDATSWAEAERYVNKYQAAPALGDAAASNADVAAGGISRRGSAAAAGRATFVWPTPCAPIVLASGGDTALGCIAARCMHLEKVLFALCDGPWRKGVAEQRVKWAAEVAASRSPASLAARLLDLERCLRRIVFHGAGSSTPGSCGWHTAWEAQRHGVLDDKLPPTPYPLGGAMGESRPAPAQPARLPASEARRLGRRGGGVLSPLATYSSRGRVLRHWASRGVRHAWVAETQGCVTASQLALQLRLLDVQIRWEAIAVPLKEASAGADKELQQVAAHTTPQLEVRHKRYILVPAPPAGPGDTQKPAPPPQYRTEYLVGTQGSNGGFDGTWMQEASAPLWAVRVYEEAVRTGGDPHAVAASRVMSRRSLSLEEVVHPQLGGSHVEVFWPATGQWYGATLVVASRAGGMRLVYDATGEADDVDVKSMETMVAQECVAVRAAREARRGGDVPGGGGALGRGQARERDRDRDRANARYVYEFHADGVPEPAACVDTEMLVQLALEWCGKDVSAMAREKVFRRKVAGMLPLGVIEAAERAAAAGLPLPRRPDGMAQSERALPRRMRKVTAPGHSDSEDDDTYIQRAAAQAQAKEDGKKGGGGGGKSKAKAPKPEPLVFSLERDDRRRAQSVLQALRQARGPDGSPMGTKFAHVPTRKESPEYHKVIKYPIDLNSIATFLQQKVTYRSPWDFAFAVELLLTNTQVYHAPGSTMHADAERMRELFHSVHRMHFGATVELPPAMALTQGITGEDPPDLPKPADSDDVAAEPPDGAGLVNTPGTEALVGARLRLWWPDDAAWYTCRVLRTSKKDGVLRHRVRYEEDDVEDWVVLLEERWEVLDQPDATGPPAVPAPKSAKRKHQAGGGAAEEEQLLPLLGDGYCVIGQQVAIQWSDGQFYEGTIESYEPYSGRHEVEYSEGDIGRESLDLTKQRVRWLDGLPEPLVDICRDCLNVLRQVKDRTGTFLAFPFEALPSPEELPSYYQFVANPMDFRRIEAKLTAGDYLDVDGFLADVQLMWDNCYVFNGPEHPYTHYSKRLRDAMTKHAGRGGDRIGGSGTVVPAVKKHGGGGGGGQAASTGVKRPREEGAPTTGGDGGAPPATAPAAAAGDALLSPPAPKKLFTLAQPQGEAKDPSTAAAAPVAFGGFKLTFKLKAPPAEPPADGAQ